MLPKLGKRPVGNIIAAIRAVFVVSVEGEALGGTTTQMDTRDTRDRKCGEVNLFVDGGNNNCVAGLLIGRENLGQPVDFLIEDSIKVYVSPKKWPIKCRSNLRAREFEPVAPLQI